MVPIFCIDFQGCEILKQRWGFLMKKTSKFSDKALYVGSLPKDGEMYDFYKIEVAGNVRYVYFQTNPERDLD